MKVTAEREGGALAISIDGRVDGSNVLEFESEVRAVIGDDDDAVILDLENLAYISSAGLRAILLTGKTLRGRNASLMLCSLSEPIRKVFEISGFDKLFAVHASRSDALASVSS